MTELTKNDMNRLEAFKIFDDLIAAVMRNWNAHVNRNGFAYAAKLAADKEFYDQEFKTQSELFVPRYAENWLKNRGLSVSDTGKNQA